MTRRKRKGRLYCFIYGHDRYVVPLIKMGICKNCGNGA